MNLKDLISDVNVNEIYEHIETETLSEWVNAWQKAALSTLTPPNEPLTPYPDGDTSIIACPHCGSGEYLHNEDGNEQNYCGQCGQAIDWSRPPEVSP